MRARALLAALAVLAIQSSSARAIGDTGDDRAAAPAAQDEDGAGESRPGDGRAAPAADAADDEDDAGEPSPLDIPSEASPPPVSDVPTAWTDVPEPPIEWEDWTIEGQLLDPPEVVRALYEPVMDQNRGWGEQQQRNVAEFSQQLGYHLRVRNEPLSAGGVRAVLDLVPITRVRRVDISFADLAEQVRHPVFKEEIMRRMRLRPGAELARDRAARAEQIREEAERVADYLRNDGFFEASVEIDHQPAGPYAVQLDVDIDKGPAYRVGDIEVVGNETISDEDIADQFRHARFCILQVCVGERRFSRQQLGDDVESVVEMYQRRGFPGARVRTTFDLRHSFKRATETVEFEVIVNERRKIDVVFEGTSDRFPHDQLADVLTFADEGNYDDVTIESSAEALRRHYQSRGYYEAYVTWERERFQFFDRIIFSIAEGPRLRVRSVAFAGNAGISDRELRSVVATTTFETFGLFREGGYATSVQLEQDVGRIERFYRSRGYRDAEVTVRVARAEALLDDAAALTAATLGGLPSPGLFIRFDIDEGEQVRVSDVMFEIEEPARLDPDALRDALGVSPGDVFVPERIEDDQEALKRYYFERGFPRAEVHTAWREAENPGGRVIVHRIRENAQKRVGQVVLRGNFKTQDWILFQELGLEEGDLLTAQAAQVAQANLRQSGLFSGVQLRYFGIEDARRETVDILVRVDERHDHTASVEVGGGWSTDSSVFVETIGSMDNIAGIGARLDARAQAGFEIQGAESTLVFPRWLMRSATGRPFLLEVTGFWRRETTERFGDLESFGGSVAATREWRRGFFRNWLVSFSYNFRQRNRNQDLIRPPGASGDLRSVPVRTRTSSIGPQLIIDKRRDEDGQMNPLAPVRGFRLDLSAQFAEDRFVGSDSFIKLGGSFQHYLELSNRLRLSNGVRYDHGIPLGGDVLLPEVERFFAGGDTTVRGFEEDRLATEVIETTVPPIGARQFRVVPASGNIRFIHNVDLQLEVWELGPFPVATAVFVDSGFVKNSLDGLSASDLRHALGVSLFRYVTPFGSLSAEWAMPLAPRIGDDPRGRFHINVGATMQF